MKIKFISFYFMKYSCRYYRLLLQKIFRFDKWHINSYEEKLYAIDIVNFCNNKMLRDNVLEIGCGLADILRRLKYNQRTGLDSEKEVLKAAKFLTKNKELNGKTSYNVFSFPDDYLNGTFDVIIMVNWIHNIAPEVLRKMICIYFLENLKKDGYIIIDTVDYFSYKYKHDIAFLSKDLSQDIIQIGSYNPQRHVWAIVKS